MLHRIEHTPAIFGWVDAALFLRDTGKAAQKILPALAQKRDEKILVGVAARRIGNGIHCLVRSRHRQFGDLCRRIKRARTPFKVHFKLIAPLVHDRYGGYRGGITQWAEAPAQYALCQVLDVVDVLAQTAAVVEAGKRFLKPVCAFTAGNTPATAFMLVELHHAERKLDHAGLVVKDDDSAGAKKFATLAERVEVHVHLLGFFRGQDERGRSGTTALSLRPLGMPPPTS